MIKNNNFTKIESMNAQIKLKDKLSFLGNPQMITQQITKMHNKFYNFTEPRSRGWLNRHLEPYPQNPVLK